MAKPGHRKLLLLLIITPLLLIIELAVGYGVYRNIQNTNQIEARNNKLDLYLRTNSKYTSYAESAQRGYLLTGETKFRDSISLDVSELKKNEEYYASLPTDVRSRDVSQIQATTRDKMSRLLLTIGLYDRGQRDSALYLVKTGLGSRMMDSIRTETTAIRNQLTDEVTKLRQHGTYLFSLFLGLITVLIVLNIFLVWYTWRKFNDYTLSLESAIVSLQDANERMAKYTSMSYHELKTPLRNISGFAQLLGRRYSSAAEGSEQSDFIRQVTDGIRQMNQTINDMRSKYLDNNDEEKV